MRSNDEKRVWLRKVSQAEDLRLIMPNGRLCRAYYQNLDRTHARAEYRVDGRRIYVYGRIVDGRLIPECRST